MAKDLKLDMDVETLAKIAQEINKNTMENRNRNKEDKIGTDKFIRRFNITRKKFSSAIKGTGIKYNRSTFLYDIPSKYLKSNTKVIPNKEIESKEIDKGNTKVLPVQKNKDKDEEYFKESNTKVIPKNEEGIVLNKKMSDLVKNVIKTNYPELEEVKDMVNWYKGQKNKEDIIEIPEINLDNPKLKGSIVTKSFKSYENVLDEFTKFCRERKETQKDLLALALIEFIEKYKK